MVVKGQITVQISNHSFTGKAITSLYGNSKNILMKRTHMYHNFAVCHKHLGLGWQIVKYSNKVTVTLFCINSIIYDSGMRHIMLLCN